MNYDYEAALLGLLDRCEYVLESSVTSEILGFRSWKDGNTIY